MSNVAVTESSSGLATSIQLFRIVSGLSFLVWVFLGLCGILGVGSITAGTVAVIPPSDYPGSSFLLFAGMYFGGMGALITAGILLLLVPISLIVAMVIRRRATGDDEEAAGPLLSMCLKIHVAGLGVSVLITLLGAVVGQIVGVSATWT